MRLVDGLLIELLEGLPAVLVVGPRATGKTTTARRHASSVIRLDRPAEAAALASDPDVGLRGLPDVRSALRDADPLGRVIDTFVVSQLRAELAVCRPGVTMFHLRQAHGRREVDVVLEAPDGRVVAVEIKASAAPTREDARHLAWLRDELGKAFVAGVVLHTGPRPFHLDDRIHALPIGGLWG